MKTRRGTVLLLVTAALLSFGEGCSYIDSYAELDWPPTRPLPFLQDQSHPFSEAEKANHSPPREIADLDSPLLPIPPADFSADDNEMEPLDEDNEVFREKGVASWYLDRKTASGEPYSRHAMTAAHRTLPFGTVVKVKNLENGREAVVRITDRGPYIRGRVIDLSEAAARRIGIFHEGVASVEVIVLGTPQIN